MNYCAIDRSVKTYLVSTFAGSVFVIFILSLNLKEPSHKAYNFDRSFRYHLLHRTTVFDIKFNSYYFAGQTSKEIYLASGTAPSHVLRIDKMLDDTTHITLKIPDIDDVKYSVFRTTVDSPYFYVMNGANPAIFRGNISDWEGRRYRNDSAFFTLGLPIDTAEFIIRSVSSEFKENVLVKESMYPHSLKFGYGLLQKQVDGIFCTDGMLHYSNDCGYLIYLYYYRNQFVCFDPDMNLMYRRNTIDPISKVNMKVGKIASDHSLTMIAPPLMVNRRSYVWRKWLFINSNIQSRNESKQKFLSSSAIDVYNVRGGTYAFSFYIPDQYGKKIMDFIADDTFIYAMYDHYIVKYQFNLLLK